MLEEAGYAFEVDPSGYEEPPPGPGEAPRVHAAQLAWRKAVEVASRRRRGLILAADTVCSVAGEILNKPLDRADAERMIRLQEGRDTEVITGVCLYKAGHEEWVGAVEISVVRFKILSDVERETYLDSNRWEGKSGGYGVQDRDPFVSVVSGSFSNVVGLPMERLPSSWKAISSAKRVRTPRHTNPARPLGECRRIFVHTWGLHEGPRRTRRVGI